MEVRKNSPAGDTLCRQCVGPSVCRLPALRRQVAPKPWAHANGRSCFGLRPICLLLNQPPTKLVQRWQKTSATKKHGNIKVSAVQARPRHDGGGHGSRRKCLTRTDDRDGGHFRSTSGSRDLLRSSAACVQTGRTAVRLWFARSSRLVCRSGCSEFRR